MSTLNGMGELYSKGGSFMNKELVKQLYVNGLNAAEIAKELKVNKYAVQKCIQRNFKDFNNLHVKNRKLLKYHEKQVMKATNYESKKYMSDKTFILKNRSIYKTNPNGDIVQRKDTDFEIPWDVPRKLVNSHM